MNNFKHALQEVDWSLTYASGNPNIAYNNFFLIFKSLFDAHFPMISKKVSEKSINKPYITNELKQLINQKHKLQKKAAKWPLTYETQFKQIRNQVTNLVRSARSLFYKNKLLSCAGNAVETWKVINKVLCRNSSVKTINTIVKQNTKITDPNLIAREFNEYFSTIGKTLADKINIDIDHKEYFGNRIIENFVLEGTNEQEIVELVVGFGDAAGGYDNILMKIMKHVIHEIKSPLAHICNASLHSGIFPDQLKLSRVIPIYKNNSKTDIANYRPLSILPSISKILEKIYYNRLQTFINNNDIIIPSQHGFRNTRSTTSAILDVTDSILKSFDKKECKVGVFLDFTKAFDTVDHNILIDKLDIMELEIHLFSG